MHKQGVEKFPYYVGIRSLSEVATREDRVCVLNILGTESSSVTPVSHEFSGGNVVFGTGPGKSGQILETKLGSIPVYNSVKEGMNAGHKINTAVIYLPPAGVKDGVAEVVRDNPDLKKVVILTEKVSVKDSRTIRAICQTNGVDVFGANCLGVADAWNQVRIGGALGGSKPQESLVKGSVAIYSNSGNFTTTIAVYLITRGWGTTTSISSGKDVYIHFAPGEFFYVLDNDERSRAAVIYVEPGGYYEHGLEINKPTVACIVGRWKARLTKACGHAGSLAGSGDDAAAKEKWFMDYFDVDDIYTPENPVFSKKGAVVTNIAYIPEALTRVMEANGIESDFEPQGDLSLKCWFADNQGLSLPPELDIPVVEAVTPYNEQIEKVNRQIGSQFPREALKDASGASMMDPKTQVTKVHNVSILDASKYSLEENLVFSLTKEHPDEYRRGLANIAFNSYVNLHGDSILTASDASREGGNSPNTVLSSAISIIGKGRVKRAIDAASVLLDLFQYQKIMDSAADFDYKEVIQETIRSSDKDKLLVPERDGFAEEMVQAIDELDRKSIFIEFCKDLARKEERFLSADTILAATWLTIGWSSLMRKKISRTTILSLPWYSMIFSAHIGCSVPSEWHSKTSFCGEDLDDLIENWSFTETAFLALIGHRPAEVELFEFTVLLGLIISNGPGTISAQGSKGAVSADGPEQPERVQLNKAFVGFLTHTGFAHGGNGYEAIEFLLERFKDNGLKDPGDPNHGIDLKGIAAEYSQWYLNYKNREKAAGNLEYRKIPCVGHPVFKGKAVNIDPREEFVSKLLEERDSCNIFLDFYRHLVQALFETGATRNVFCVNVDAVIAVILLKAVWNLYREGELTEKDIENAAFTTFLFGRMIGCAAEIDDHINRGRNMDTRTPASKCSFVG
ncbi:MAG: CoA-binding protein [Nitrospinota bacterium]